MLEVILITLLSIITAILAVKTYIHSLRMNIIREINSGLIDATETLLSIAKSNKEDIRNLRANINRIQ